MAEESETGSKPPVHPDHAWASAIKWIGIVLILTGAAIYIFKSCRELPVQTIERAGRALATVAAAFKQGTLTTSFISYATTISNYHRLQLSTLRQTEVFSQTNQMSTAFGYVPLPDVVVEARAPVEYTYYLDLNAPWQLVLKDQIIYVAAPKIEFNKPSVDASAINYEVRKGHLKTAEAQESLKRSITSLVTLRAKENVPLVRESVRKQTEEFVEKWLSKSFPDGKQYPVKVYFPGETVPPELKQELISPPAK